jgi:putative polyhydroxyalkanoate system protein
MPTPIAVEIPHQLTQAEAKTRLENGVAEARQKYGQHLRDFRETWSGDRMDFAGTVMGQNISGRIDVKPASVRVEVDVPMLLAMFARKFIPQVEAEGRRLLEKK